MGRANAGFIGTFASADPTTAPGVWNINGAASRVGRINTIGATTTWPQSADANFSSVTLLCHCEYPDTANANTTGIGMVSTVGGSMAQGVGGSGAGTPGLTAFTSKFGQYSWFSSGVAGRGLTNTQVSSGLTFGTGDFTIELFFYMPVSNTNQNLFDPRTTANQAVPLIYFDASSKMRYLVSNADRITGGTVVSQNAWHHIAVARVSSVTKLYLDGAQEGSNYSDSTNYISITTWYWGAQFIGSAGAGAKGYYDEIRITKGVGRYSGATYTVPTTPFPDY